MIDQPYFKPRNICVKNTESFTGPAHAPLPEVIFTSENSSGIQNSLVTRKTSGKIIQLGEKIFQMEWNLGKFSIFLMSVRPEVNLVVIPIIILTSVRGRWCSSEAEFDLIVKSRKAVQHALPVQGGGRERDV